MFNIHSPGIGVVCFGLLLFAFWPRDDSAVAFNGSLPTSVTGFTIVVDSNSFKLSDDGVGGSTGFRGRQGVYEADIVEGNWHFPGVGVVGGWIVGPSCGFQEIFGELNIDLFTIPPLLERTGAVM